MIFIVNFVIHDKQCQNNRGSHVVGMDFCVTCTANYNSFFISLPFDMPSVKKKKKKKDKMPSMDN